MIKSMKIDITDIRSGIVAHGCNCQGKMGSGVAKAIRNKWPEVYTAFRAMYDDGESNPGAIQIVKINDTLHIANLYTQEYYGNDGKVYADIDLIDSCIRRLLSIEYLQGQPLYIPKIGCGLGGLNWEQVQNRLTLIPRSDRIIVCEL